MTPLRLRYWDARLHAAIGALPDTPADRWLRRLTTAADHGRLWIAVALLLGLRRGRSRRAAVRGLGSLTVASSVVNTVLKRVFGRVRPDLDAMAGHRRLPRAPSTLSFPSGHSSSAGAFATGVAMESPLAGAVLAPLALAVGYSRVHVGVHYPGDVVSGLAIGAGVALAGRRWWPVRPTEPAR
ncbi:MAG TPA: phosphatase PAP2 family protein, partial [Geodermatophilus sp.]|nr:phosphatase PAP2 family protein [Geodermatophilus sp.]